MTLLGETDEEHWGRRWGEYHMEWKPSHDERSYLGGYTMGLGSPRAIYARAATIARAVNRAWTCELVSMHRARAIIRLTPRPGLRTPRWFCSHARTMFERFPTNWGLPGATLIESQCAATGRAGLRLEPSLAQSADPGPGSGARPQPARPSAASSPSRRWASPGPCAWR